MKSIEGETVDLAAYQGRVVLMVNVASRCGLTPQYKGLQALYDSHKDRGFVILGFPANNFRGQEPGTDAEIKEFCSLNYGVTFPLFSKISVAGDDIHPLYAHLTGKETNPSFAGPITWNFAKFLVGRDGRVAARFEPKIPPDHPDVVSAVERELRKLSPVEALGKRLFFDEKLSSPEGQSCAACHAPEVGMTGPDSALNAKGSVYEGALRGRFGNRKPPAASYAGDSPRLHRDEEGVFVGGMFWDGRATGEKLGDPLAEQAMGPFLNPLEQNLADAAAVVKVVRAAEYAALFEQVWGKGSLAPEKPADEIFALVAKSIAAYERSAEVNPFSSKFDDFWRAAKKAGKDVAAIDASNGRTYQNLGLDDEELEGLRVFNTDGLCSACHVLTSVGGKPPLFTDFTYDNLGIPRNPDNPFYKMGAPWNPDGPKWVDEGLGGFLKTVPAWEKYAAENRGKHKVPTLRNVDLRPEKGFVKAFGHNGYFKSLEDIVHFYNARDVDPGKWPAPEVSENVNTDEMGQLGLTEKEEAALVRFLKTLSDRLSAIPFQRTMRSSPSM